MIVLILDSLAYRYKKEIVEIVENEIASNEKFAGLKVQTTEQYVDDEVSIPNSERRGFNGILEKINEFMNPIRQENRRKVFENGNLVTGENIDRFLQGSSIGHAFDVQVEILMRECAREARKLNVDMSRRIPVAKNGQLTQLQISALKDYRENFLTEYRKGLNE